MKVYGLDKLFIAEVKTISPFGFKSPYSADDLLNFAVAYGDMVSIHVDALWNGTHNDLRVVKRHLRDGMQPLLAKGLHLYDNLIQNSLEAGADSVLVVGRIPAKKYLAKCYMEPLTTEQLMTSEYAEAVRQSAGLVLNTRDLFTGEMRLPDYPNPHEWVSYWTHAFDNSLIDFKKDVGVPIIQASGIKNMKNIHPEVDGFIVGEHLPAFILQKLLLRK
jgi:indole-3-glycerol phosphate synthase